MARNRKVIFARDETDEYPKPEPQNIDYWFIYLPKFVAAKNSWELKAWQTTKNDSRGHGNLNLRNRRKIEASRGILPVFLGR